MDAPRPIAAPTHERLAAIAKALAHPARVQILDELIRRGTCLCGELVEVMPLAQSTVSQHLKVLKNAGLVQGTIDGPRSCYRVDEAGLAELAAGIDAMRSAWRGQGAGQSREDTMTTGCC
jgi:ArsR family transcriptional regulator